MSADRLRLLRGAHTTDYGVLDALCDLRALLTLFFLAALSVWIDGDEWKSNE
jgi:hypothetical protein